MSFKHFAHIALLAGLAFFIAEGQGAVIYAAEEAAPAEQEKELKFAEKMAAIFFEEAEDAFVYKRQGRTDPFLPFIREIVAATEAPTQELTGMRKFEPGQLTVVAIIMRHNDKFAMVETANRHGYIIREEMLLGRTGVVEAIAPNKVVVKNYTYNLAGDRIYKAVEMLLKKEGER